MISSNLAVAAVCGALLVAAGATLTVCRLVLGWEPRRAALGLQEASVAELEAELAIARAEEGGDLAEELSAVPERGYWGPPPRVLIARFRQDVSSLTADFDRRLDELIAA